MDETYDPILPDDPVLPDDLDLPKSKASIPAPLPRLWKSPPEPVEVDEPAPAQGKKKKAEAGDKNQALGEKIKSKKKKVDEPLDDGTGASKLEETPVLDTFEARQRARWIIGGLLGAIGMIAVFLVLKTFKGNGEEEIREGEPPPVLVASEARSNGEAEARTILNMAKQSDKLGKTQAAVDLLNKLAKTYQGTAAGREAMHAIERHRRNQALFGVDAPEQVSGPKAPNSAAPLATGPAGPKATGVPPESGTKPPKAADLANVAPAPIAPVVPAVPLKPLPRGYRAILTAPVHPSGWPTRLVCDYDGGELVLVPGGTFIMGREDGEANERPAHTVTLSTYYIDRNEVTVRQYRLFLKETGRPYETAKLGPEDQPVVNVSAREAKAFCEWARRKLPTEAQWEMAARCPAGKVSFWGGELPRKDPIKGPRPMEPVMSLPSDLSACGAYDLGANAWEWTSEYYDSQYYLEFRNPVTDPTGPKTSKAKIALVTVKGGSKLGILTWRDGLKIETRQPYLGFRGALSVEGIPAAPASAPVPAPSNTNPLPGGVVPF